MENQERPLAIVAMGGHAFMQSGQPGTIEIHEKNAADICAVLMTLVDRNYNIVITHGNGPQVGNLLLQTELTREQIPAMPLDVLVAYTEGSLGYIMQQAMINQLNRRSKHRFVVTVVSQVVVDRHDPAFDNPTKPVGPFLEKEEAEERREKLGWKVVDDAGRGWRRVVPSPTPKKVIQSAMISDAARNGHIVIACGGGGVPVIRNTQGDFEGVEAVIDKDLTSSILASEIGAELLIILTDVPQVYTNYNTPEQKALGAVTMEEVDRLIGKGHFAPGSMGPKIQGIYNFLRAGGRRGLITNPQTIDQALQGRGGTHFVGRL